MIEMIRQGLQADGITVSISKLCRWFEVPRRTVYYRSVKSAPKVQARFAEPIKEMIEESPTFTGQRYDAIRPLCLLGCQPCSLAFQGLIGSFLSKNIVVAASLMTKKRAKRWRRAAKYA